MTLAQLTDLWTRSYRLLADAAFALNTADRLALACEESDVGEYELLFRRSRQWPEDGSDIPFDPMKSKDSGLSVNRGALSRPEDVVDCMRDAESWPYIMAWKVVELRERFPVHADKPTGSGQAPAEPRHIRFRHAPISASAESIPPTGNSAHAVIIIGPSNEGMVAHSFDSPKSLRLKVKNALQDCAAICPRSE